MILVNKAFLSDKYILSFYRENLIQRNVLVIWIVWGRFITCKYLRIPWSKKLLADDMLYKLTEIKPMALYLMSYHVTFSTQLFYSTFLENAFSKWRSFDSKNYHLSNSKLGLFIKIKSVKYYYFKDSNSTINLEVPLYSTTFLKYNKEF